MGGLVCFYNPNDMCPKFWFFKSGDSISYICKNILSYCDEGKIHVHINDVKFLDSKQSKIYNQFIGMLHGISQFRNVSIKIVSKEKVQSRIMHLLDIKIKKEFHNKILSKKMHNNQYNLVYDMVKLRSKQVVNCYMWSYLLAYYGFLKDKISSYNKKEQ